MKEGRLFLAIATASLLLLSSCSSASVAAFLVWFVSDRDGSREIFSMMSNGANVTQITNGRNVNSIDITTDGNTLTFDQSDVVYIMNADGSGATALGAGRGPAINQNGTKIAYSVSLDIWIMNADGSNPQNLTNSGNSEEEPDFGSGGRIVFEKDDDIWVMNDDGTGQQNLTMTPGVFESHSSWFQDSSRILFRSSATGSGDIYSIRPDGTDLRRETFSSHPDWGPRVPSDNKHLFWYQNQGGNFEVMKKVLGQTAETNLTVNGASDLGPAIPGS